MSLLSITVFLTSKVMKLSTIFSICLILLITPQSSSAFNLEINDVKENKITNNQSYTLTKSSLVNEGFIEKLPNLWVFKERDPTYFINLIQNKYLTFYSKKNKKIKATYDSGAYLIKYTHHW